MEVGALQQMLSRFRQLQEDLQRQVNSVTVEASAGGGMVMVKMNGQKQVVDVRIEPDVFASKDQEMLQDLIRAAVNEDSRIVLAKKKRFSLQTRLVVVPANDESEKSCYQKCALRSLLRTARTKGQAR